MRPGLGDAPFSLSTQGNLLPVVLWHGLFNTLVASEASQGLIAAVVTTGIMILAVFALIVAGPSELRGLSPKAGSRQQHGTRSISTRAQEAA